MTATSSASQSTPFDGSATVSPVPTTLRPALMKCHEVMPRDFGSASSSSPWARAISSTWSE